jgi:hypothetical protein
MALTNWSNSDLFSALRDKFNAVITFLTGGTAGQIAKSTAGGDPVWTSEFAYKCAATSTSFSVATNYVSRAFTVPANMQFDIGNRIRATGSAGNWVEGVVTDYSATTLTILIDRINGTGSFTAWTISPGDGASETLTQTTTAGTTASILGVVVGTESYIFNYIVRNNLMYLSFKATLNITTGTTVSKILLPLPTGITKDTSGASSGYEFYGFASYLSSSAGYSITCLLENYDDGAEGQRIKLSRISDGSASIVISNGSTSTIKGNIVIPIL